MRCACETCGSMLDRNPDETWKKLCLSCWKETARAKERAKAPPPPQFKVVHFPVPARIPHDMLRRMLQLCHPDKHGGSEMAVVVTQWLLKHKDEKEARR